MIHTPSTIVASSDPTTTVPATTSTTRPTTSSGPNPPLVGGPTTTVRDCYAGDYNNSDSSMSPMSLLQLHKRVMQDRSLKRTSGFLPTTTITSDQDDHPGAMTSRNNLLRRCRMASILEDALLVVGDSSWEHRRGRHHQHHQR